MLTTASQDPLMRLCRDYLSRADGLWRRHKARAVMLTALAGACAAGWLVKRAAAWVARHVRTARREDG
jgi:hypothetical protein